MYFKIQFHCSVLFLVARYRRIKAINNIKKFCRNGSTKRFDTQQIMEQLMEQFWKIF